MTNKLVLIVIILLEICILTGLVYYKFFSWNYCPQILNIPHQKCN
jgi:hypothetical protein